VVLTFVRLSLIVSNKIIGPKNIIYTELTREWLNALSQQSKDVISQQNVTDPVSNSHSNNGMGASPQGQPSDLSKSPHLTILS